MKTKDYSKVKYVKPSVDATDITKGKVYEYNYLGRSLGTIIDNSDDTIIIRIPKCSFLLLKHWIPCDKDGNEI